MIPELKTEVANDSGAENSVTTHNFICYHCIIAILALASSTLLFSDLPSFRLVTALDDRSLFLLERGIPYVPDLPRIPSP